MLDCFLTENELEWENCIGVCSDGAQTMAGKRKELRALIKKASPHAEWTHCIIHREALASRQLYPELSEVMTDIIGIGNFITTRPLKKESSPLSVRRWELNIKLCSITVKQDGCHEEKSCPEFLSSESR